MKQGKKGRVMQAHGTVEAKPRLGRPPKESGTMTKPFQMRLPDDLLAAVDAVAAQLPDRQERSVAIRMLLREALAARGKGRKV